ncbi:interleukin-7 isoform X2 [Tupaia chinensis]|uniref:Interleukin-7 n=1 Tax=Tupaia chinensis TaxID=246437 RepID=L7NU82_TUPCH|nr:interleukin-7 isoform X2 [Tupaia chinensis]AFA42956.1 interleukin-7 variant 3 [Tupaia chinensis]
MFHVSFRYIFGIPPLILVLLPGASSDCDIDGKSDKVFGNILMVSFNALDSMRDICSNCQQNASNFFKKNSCDDNKEVKFLYRAVRKLKQCNKTNNSEEFNDQAERISKTTLILLNCTSKEEKKLLKEQKKQDDSPCFVKRLLDEIKTCWNKILRGAKKH